MAAETKESKPDKKDKETKGTEFTCRFCGAKRPLEDLRVIYRFSPPLVVCADCEKKLG